MSLFARRAISTSQRTAVQLQKRTFHSPFAVLSRATSPESSQNSTLSRHQEELSSVYTKQASPVEESISTSSNSNSANDNAPRIHVSLLALMLSVNLIKFNCSIEVFLCKIIIPIIVMNGTSFHVWMSWCHALGL
ncbi:hypothetical protein PNOK_0838400 [Pyrrhoderma noxium]|uniref:Uncharacterized protein n=1 Tax=Pyrrhoderma noxium TaxID=2282107 RepID=A0A286UB59_9AGAM|nr:hypothetical protein PNOK_0838400 [Pyrrhoderma noxium]